MSTGAIFSPPPIAEMPTDQGILAHPVGMTLNRGGWRNFVASAGPRTQIKRQEYAISDKQLILSYFADQAAAESAASSLKTSGVAEGDAVGVLVLDGTGNVVIDKVGATSVAAGVGVGAALLVLGPFFLGFVAAAAVVRGGRAGMEASSNR